MHVIASSFADPADVAAFKRAKARGLSDTQAFAVGDNGIGFWGDNTAQTTTPMCALPPEDMIERYGFVHKAARKPVLVTYKGRSITCILADRMPHRANIKNGAGIDLNPAAIAQLGLPKGAMVVVDWRWADEGGELKSPNT